MPGIVATPSTSSFFASTETKATLRTTPTRTRQLFVAPRHSEINLLVGARISRSAAEILATSAASLPVPDAVNHSNHTPVLIASNHVHVPRISLRPMRVFLADAPYSTIGRFIAHFSPPHCFPSGFGEVILKFVISRAPPAVPRPSFPSRKAVAANPGE